ncbi:MULTISPECIES: CmcJ/NvfI family oxidoreductase [unclassified Geodermatophilus]|uniref:CmcJ/NvfI family oxidoreductase n=1 Tax=unclassified Geodermatophilus TaxID=2637632 RepID=UPI003EE861F5
MTLTPAPDQGTAVQAELSYLAEGSTVLRRFTAPGHSVNTGRYETHVVPIRNGRPVQDRFTVAENGFRIARHESAVRDFTDKPEVDDVYVPEVLDFVKEQLGADRVVSRGWVLRRSAAPGENASQPQAGLVHIDYAPEGAAEMAAAVYAEHCPDGPGFRRAVATSTWRVFSPPPQDWPLALCDFRSVAPGDGLPNTLYFVDRVPDDPFGPVDGLTRVTSGSEFHHDPAHEWWYFPDMTRDEVLFFVFHDSDHERAWRVPHSAFRDPTAQATVPRHSIEVRTFAFFE